MLQYCFYYSLPLYYCAIFNSLDATIRVSNSLDPDQARHFVFFLSLVIVCITPEILDKLIFNIKAVVLIVIIC